MIEPTHSPRETRRPYTKPRVRAFGGLAAVTRNVGTTSKSNDKGDGMTKTS
jgi:hypothetical protein